MNFIKKYFIKIKNRHKIKDEECNNLILEIKKALSSLDEVFIDKLKIIELDTIQNWEGKNIELFNKINTISLKKYKRSNNYRQLVIKVDLFKLKYKGLLELVQSHNEFIYNNLINEASTIIGDIEGNRLDKSQLKAIVKNEENQLVIAGAGCGKTTTIIGKVKYLLNTKKCTPDEILLLSFTHKTAVEMKKRIKKETGYNLDVNTFHKLGLTIIRQVDGITPRITKMNFKHFIIDELNKQINSSKYLSLLCNYFLYRKHFTKKEFDFNNRTEYESFLKNNPPTTLKGEQVKSNGELEIANFFTEYGIEYTYEKEYKIDTRTDSYSQYYPDFYLPKYDVYIEYYSIDRNGNVPKYYEEKPDMSAKEAYNQSIKWKRGIHKENNTKLIELFAFQNFENILLEELYKELEKYNIKLKKRNPKDIWNEINKNEKYFLNSLASLFETIINLAKNNNYTINDLRLLDQTGENQTILELIDPIFNSYNDYLIKNNEIDFNDMINIASNYIIENKFIHNYKYVIIDEYQDISKSRYLLLKNMRQIKNYKLFCVGDDWQSIYRFSGSDVGYTLKFDHYFPIIDIDRIETTYRFSNKLINVSSNFIMKNPEQLKKNIVGYNNNIPVIGSITAYNQYSALEYMNEKIYELPENSTIFLIGRYSFDIDIIKNSQLYDVFFDNQSERIKVICKKRKDLHIEFLTAHRAKGLEADYVFIINNKRYDMGFPSTIQDDPFLSLLLDNSDNYPFAEERRLYYVALTRARIKVILIIINNNISPFAKEIIDNNKEDIKMEKYSCPLCGGRLRKINGQYGVFYGCSNFNTNNCKFKRKAN